MSPTVLFAIHLVAATAKNNPRLAELKTIKTLQDTLKFPQVNYVGSSLATRQLANAHVSYLNSTDAIFQFLLLNRADLFLDTDVVLSYNAARLHVLDQIELLPPSFEVTEFRLGISKKSPFAADMPALSRAINAMQEDGTIAAILKRYTR
jgi:ABC-type amino acid transport substrate-binding protein